MKLSLQLGLIAVINIGLSFIYQWYVLAKLGPGMETDALFAGMTIPQLVLAVISSSLMHVLVPLLAGEGEQDIRRDAWSFLALITGLFSLLSVSLYAAAQWWVPLTVPGFSPAGKELTIQLTCIQLVGMVFTAINGVQWAAYHARQKFLWAEFTPILTSAFALLLLVWALPRYGVVAAAWINTVRMALQTLLLAPGMGRPLWPDLRRTVIRQAWRRIQPLLLGTTYYKTDPLIDRFMLSSASSGSLSLFYLAQQIYGAASQVMNKAFAAPLVPAFSNLVKQGDQEGFWKLYRRKLVMISLFGILGVVVFVCIGNLLLNLLVGHGSINENNVGVLWLIMVLMSGQFIIGNMGVVMTSMFFALGDTRSPTISGSIAYTIGIPLRVIMFSIFGINGLATAISFFYIISLILMMYQVRKVRNAQTHQFV